MRLLLEEVSWPSTATWQSFFRRNLFTSRWSQRKRIGHLVFNGAGGVFRGPADTPGVPGNGRGAPAGEVLPQGLLQPWDFAWLPVVPCPASPRDCFAARGLHPFRGPVRAVTEAGAPRSGGGRGGGW